MRRASTALAAAALALAGCTALGPYATEPAAPRTGAHEAGSRVAICSAGFAGSRAEVRRMAQKECPPHTAAVLVATDWWLEHCPILLPARATFVCSPDK
jgi:hypothetical protein